jgi:hypothetical protein
MFHALFSQSKSKLWYILRLLSSIHPAIITACSPSSSDRSYECLHVETLLLRNANMYRFKKLSLSPCFRSHEPFIQQLTPRYDYVTFTSTCGTPLTAATPRLQGITKEAVPHSDPSTLGNAVENHYMEGIYKGNTNPRYTQQAPEKCARNIQTFNFRIASHSIR